MVKKRLTLRSAVGRFAEDLRSVTQQLNDNVSFLSRATQHKPCVGPREFQQVLSDLQDEVSEITTEVEVLERFTVDTISFEELLGHCVALYQANRGTIQLLEEHLQQYGYQPPAGVAQEPENPVAAAAVAAAKARRAGDAGEEDEDDLLGFRAPGPSTRSALSKASANDGAGPGKSVRPSAHNKERKHVLLKTPGCAGGAAAAAKRPNLRKATPGSKLGVDVMDCSSGEDEEAGGRQGDDDSAGNLSDDGLDTVGLKQQRLGGGSSFAHRPTGAMASKGQVLVAAQASCYASALTAAASVRASARKAPRPSVDSHASSTPEAMMLSPSVAELLAKYNPPSGSSPMPSRSAKPNAPNMEDEDGALGSDAMVVGMQGLTPFGRKEAPTAADVRAKQPPLAHVLPAAPPVAPAAAPPAATTVGAAKFAPPAPVAAPAQQQPPQEFRRPSAEEDTCALYEQLIRSRHVPSSLNSQRLRQPPKSEEPTPSQPQLQAPAPVQSAAVALQPVDVPWHQLKPPQPPSAPDSRRTTGAGAPLSAASPATSAGGAESGAVAGDTPPPMTARARSVTPRSVQRTQFQATDKLLAEKLEGLKVEFSGLKQAWGHSAQPSPERRSFVFNSSSDGGGPGNANGPSAATLADLRAKSPGPSRAAIEAAAAAEAILAGSSAGGSRAAAPAAAAAFAAAPPVTQQPRLQEALQPRQPLAAFSRANAAPEAANCGRVLSPVQQASSSDAPAASTPSRTARVSRLPVPGASCESTTVVGAVLTPRCDGAGAADANGRAATVVTPKRTGALASRGTPCRVPKPVPSSGSTGTGAGGGTPVRAPQKCASPVLPGAASGRDGGAATPGRITRAGAAAAAAAAAVPLSARASRVTPPHRQSCAAALPGMAAAMAAGAEPVAATPRAGRVGAGVPVAPNRTPGRISVADARNVSFTTSSAATDTSLAAAAAAAASQLQAKPSVRPDAWSDAGKSVEKSGDWQGFPLSRRMPGGDQYANGRLAPARRSDDVTLGMPPAVPLSPGALAEMQAGDTPRASTPGRGIPSAVGATSTAQVAVAASTVAGLSPTTSKFVSRLLGEGCMENFRPSSAAAGNLSSRIPVPVSASPRPATASPGPRSGIGGGSGAFTSRQPIAAATEAAAAVAAAAAAPLPCDVELCSEEEWRGLPARTQQAFRLDVLNKHLRTLAQLVASRPPSGDAVTNRCFLVADVEALTQTTMSAKLLINTLVKLGRCDVASGASSGEVLYRLRA